MIEIVEHGDDAGLRAILAFEAEHGSPRFTELEPVHAWIDTMLAVRFFVAREHAGGDLVGSAAASITNESERGTIHLNLFAAPGRVGVLRELLDAVRVWAAERGVSRIYCHVTDPTEHVQGDLEAIGFRLGNDRFSQIRELTADDRELQVDVPDDMRVVSLADEPELEDSFVRVWLDGMADVPSEMQFAMSDVAGVRDFMELGANDPWPDGVRVLAEGDEVVALCSLVPTTHHGPGMYGHRLTAVARSHRGRGLASVIKRDAIRWAARNGVVTLRTSNDQDNAAMLRVNEQLGFRVARRISVYSLDVDTV